MREPSSTGEGVIAMKRILAARNWLAEREHLLWICLLLQIVAYWTFTFFVPPGGELVAYQRF